MGKKAKNATFLSGNEAGKISREVAKVEKRRIVKSTHCNDRSSRSHCMIILDVPTVGGRLMLVDMAGSENIEQAGQLGFEAKIQTAKINQGNTALKRVVESIANGDSHVPFRDSKLTMLLQDSFEDDKAKILMILCAIPDPKELYKTISTLEYGAKAKCIVRGVHTPNKDTICCEDGSSAVILGSRIAAMDQFILKLQMENKRREKERNEAHKELMKKEEEVAALRAKLELMERMNPVESEEEINLKVKEREQILKLELEKKLQECQKMANEYVEMGRRRMEEKILQQQEELELLRRRLEELESELHHSKDNTGGDKSRKVEGGGFAKRLMDLYADQGMEKSMDLDTGDQQQTIVHVVKEEDTSVSSLHKISSMPSQQNQSHLASIEVEDDGCLIAPKHTEKRALPLSTAYEEEGQYKENMEDEEVEKLVVEESPVHISRKVDDVGLTSNNTDSIVVPQNLQMPKPYYESFEKVDCYSLKKSEGKGLGLGLMDTSEDTKDPASARRTRIQNIFLLCGNHRELARHVRTPTPYKKKSEAADVPMSPAAARDENSVAKSFSKENSPLQKENSPLQTAARVPEFVHARRVLSDVTTRNTIETPSTGLHVEPFASLKLLNDQNLARSHLPSSRV